MAPRKPAEPEAQAETPTVVPDGLDRKLAAVMGEMERVAKTGYNDAQRYKFAQEGDVADMIRASLSRHRINFHVTMAEAPRFEPIRSAKGTEGDRCHVHLRVTLVDADNPEAREETDWWGYADDYQDKAVGKAVTGTKKSYLVTRFLVSTGEPEPDGAGIERASTQQAQPQQAQGPRPNPADSRKATQPMVSRIFAIAAKAGVDGRFAARWLTRTEDRPRGYSVNELTQAQARYVADSLEALHRMAPEEKSVQQARLGTWSARLVEVEEAEKAQEAAEGPQEAPPGSEGDPQADTPEEPEEPHPDAVERRPESCTCGVGDQEMDPDKHADSCSMSIPF